LLQYGYEPSNREKEYMDKLANSREGEENSNT